MQNGKEVKIEKGVPMPKYTGRKKYPFDQMKVGDSILVAPEIGFSARSAAQTYGRAMGRNWRFSGRKTPDGFRVWRIE